MKFQQRNSVITWNPEAATEVLVATNPALANVTGRWWVDRRIAERIDGGAAVLQFLDGESYRGLFCLSKKHRATLAAETKVLSTEKGTFSFMHSQGLSVAEAK